MKLTNTCIQIPGHLRVKEKKASFESVFSDYHIASEDECHNETVNEENLESLGEPVHHSRVVGLAEELRGSYICEITLKNE